jgi:D-beta-D-heptose 7-phosphate kinase/D-beta-D-heptose 1-phosphate adenosyltransferase
VIEQLHEAIQAIEYKWVALRLLVVGDVMLDKYIWGDVGRISPEAPVPVVRATRHSHQPGGEDKVVTREELVRRVALWKANDERMVFTNGCFDLLHIGHITLLEQARRFGDRVIVAINSDASVRGLKGADRPVVGERERARVLAALSAVDAVVVFSEPTPLEIIVATQPDVIVKGGDYTVETVVGASEVMAWGGEVKIVPLVQGFSTTQLIAKSIYT